ncbi:MAG: hypothetical protein IJQ89_07220, partial [Bacteroidales bacterium]|nr:hypothetical protein [Bacteroidales bacterium]
MAYSTATNTLSWTAGGTETEWEIEYGSFGFAHGAGTIIPVNTTPSYTFANPLPGGDYDFYVRPVCGVGDTGYWKKLSLTIPCGGSGTQADPYLICNEAALRALATTVNGGNNCAGVYYRVSQNIVLTQPFTPIGTSYTYPFSGHFDGDGHTISNLTMDVTTSNLRGLFGVLKDADVQNVTISGTVTGNDTVGGIAGASLHSTIKNCVNNCTIANYSNARWHGGIVGAAHRSRIIGCVNNGVIQGAQSYHGGIVGFANLATTIRGCVNTGTIEGNSYYHGGIVGHQLETATTFNDSVGFFGCVNRGTVEGSYYTGGICGNSAFCHYDSCVNNGTVTSNSYDVGGIAGYSNADATHIQKISHCTDSANVTGSYNVGGIIGYATYARFDSCLNHGVISSTSTTAGSGYATGGIAAYATYTSFKNCRSDAASQVLGYQYVGGIVGYAYLRDTLFKCSNAGVVGGYNSSNNSYRGGIVAYLYGGAVATVGYMDSCVNTGTVSGTTYIGGLAAHSYQSQIYDSRNSGTINGSQYTGGIVGYSAGNNTTTLRNVIDHCQNSGAVTSTASGYVGGMAGYITYTRVDSCFNTGNVTGAQYNGGMVGYLYVVSDITRCSNRGAVRGTGSYTGGILGYVYSTNSTYRNIKYNINSGKVSSSSTYVGGIVGGNLYYTYLEYNVNHGDVSSTYPGASYVGGIVGGQTTNGYVRYNLNAGLVSSQGNTVGGITGTGASAALTTYNLNVNNVTGNTNVAAISGSGQPATNNYWDKQMCPTTYWYGTTANATYAKETNDLVGVATYPGTAYFTAVTDKYPIPTGLQDSMAAKVAATPILLQNSEDVNAVATNFPVDNSQNVNWTSSNPSAVSVAGTAATVGTAGITTFTAANGGLEKHVVLIVTPTAFCGGTGTKVDPYLICNEAQLDSLAMFVNNGFDFQNTYFKVVRDLNMINYQPWRVIGNSTNHPFKGHFDGDGHTISNLAINSGSPTYCGLFGYVIGTSSDTCFIHDFTIKGSFTGSSYTGAAVGWIQYGKVANVTNFATISGYNNYHGGIVGYASYTDVVRCVNRANVTGSQYTGGIVGYSELGARHIDTCINSGAVNSNSTYVGGIVGRQSSSYVQHCSNSGDVTSTTSSAASYVGGISGYMYSSAFVRYNLNGGLVKSNGGSVGGIVGRATGTITYNINVNNVIGGGVNIGAIAGEGSVGTTNVWDKQMCPNNYLYGTTTNPGSQYTTAQLVGSQRPNSTYFTATPGLYPIPNGISDSIGAKLAATPVTLNNPEYVDSTATSFTVGTANGVSWSSSNTSMLTISGSNATVVNSGLVTLSGTTQNLIKHVRIIIRPQFCGGSGTQVDPYLICTPLTLDSLAMFVNMGMDFAGCYFKVINDLDMFIVSNYKIVGSSQSTPFRGHFDGDGHTISNLLINNAGTSYRGVFGYVAGYAPNDRAEIHDLTVRGTINGGSYTGGIVGYATYCDLYKLTNYATFNSGYSYRGGIAGTAYEYCRIDSCYNYSDVPGSQYVGGIVGQTYNYVHVSNVENTGNVNSVSSPSYVGGILGYQQSYGSIRNAVNSGNITASGYYSGGIVGYQGSSDTIENVSNTGNVNSTQYYVGGVVGYKSSSGFIRYATNTGKVSGTYYLGGIAGYMGSSQFITNCKNTGEVAGTSYQVGGIVGYFSSGNSSLTSVYQVANDTNTGKVSGTYQVGGIVGYGDYCRTRFCENRGDVLGTSYHVGGVVGYNYRYSIVSGSNNYGNVKSAYTGTSYTGTTVGVGGIAGESYYNTSANVATIDSCNNYGDVQSGAYCTGGIVGLNYYYGHVRKSFNYGKVTGTYYVGGVAGNSYASSSTTVNYCPHITACGNSGEVTGTGSYVGGIAGRNGHDANSYYSTIESSVNHGRVSGAQYVGGIAGRNYSTNASYKARIIGCLNAGAVSASTNYAGGICGYNNNSNSAVDSCLNVGNVKTAGANKGGVDGSSVAPVASYYDTMMCPVPNDYNGHAAGSTVAKRTSALTDGSFNPATTLFTVTAGLYPRPKAIANHPATILAATPVFYSETDLNNTDSVTTCYTVGTGNNVTWTSLKPMVTSITDTLGVPVSVGDTTIVAHKDSLKKEVDVRITFAPAINTFTYPTIIDTIGKRFGGYMPSLTGSCLYSSPDLPEGLTINPNTGEIGGLVLDTIKTSFNVIASCAGCVMAQAIVNCTIVPMRLCVGATYTVPAGQQWYYDAAYSQPVTGSTITISDTTVLYAKAEPRLVSTDFAYTGATQVYNIPAGTDTLVLEVWGAEGGYRSYQIQSGKGGYSVGKLPVNGFSTLYVNVGQFGGVTTSSAGSSTIVTGGWNGGGNRYGYKGGGGATDISAQGIAGSATWNTTDHLYSRIIVAGGGGSCGANSNSATSYNGGYGGGLSGGTAGSGCGSGGMGGTQTAGGTGGSSNSGTFGEGGVGKYNANGYGGAGGGGWYGGGGAYPDGSADDDKGGGGGSGYVYTSATAANYPSGCLLNSNYYLVDARTVAGNEDFPNIAGTANETGHEGNGFARISRYEYPSPKLVIINPYPEVTARISGDTHICDPSERAKLTLDFTGGAPYRFRITGDNADRISNTDHVEIWVAPTQSMIYTVTYTSAVTGCEADSMRRTGRALVEVCNNRIICDGDTAFLPGAYTWYHDAGLNVPVGDTIDFPSQTKTYYRTGGYTYTVNVLPRATATIKDTLYNICDNSTINLEIEFVGQAPFTYRITGDVADRTTNSNRVSIPVQPDSSLQYRIISFTDALGHCLEIENTSTTVLYCDQPIICEGDTVWLRGQWFYDAALTQPVLEPFVVPDTTTTYYRYPCQPDTTDFAYTGDVQTYVVPSGVDSVFMQVWGAQGGNSVAHSSAIGGKGGYSEGRMLVTPGQTLYVYVGGKGNTGITSVDGGWNGGGGITASISYSSGTAHMGTGGGATDISTVGGACTKDANFRWVRTAASYAGRVIVAGGGGGAEYGSGTAGGGLSGEGTYAGTQSAAGTAYNYNASSYVTFYNGGLGYGASTTGGHHSHAMGACGGGGYYGGGAYAYNGSVSTIQGFGGSGYIAGLDDARTVAGNTSFPNVAGTGNETGHAGDGYARIITVCGGSGGAGVTAVPFKIIVNPAPKVTVHDTTWEICNGDYAQMVIDFEGTAPFHYRITGDNYDRVTSSNRDTIYLRPSTTSRFRVTYFADASGCDADGSDDFVSINVCNQPIICAGDSAALPTGTWYFDQALTQQVTTPKVAPNVTTTYYGANNATFTVSVNPQASAYLRGAVISKCDNSSENLHITFTGGTAPFRYRITGDTADRISNSNIVDIPVNPDSSMRYRILSFSDAYCYGNIANTEVSITICDQPIVCSGDTVWLPAGYNWYYDAAKTQPIRTNFVIPTQSTTYYRENPMVNFAYTGDTQIYVVPAGVHELHLQTWGAQGGSGTSSSTTLYAGGKGGYSEGDLPVHQGDTLYVFVGGKGKNSEATTNIGVYYPGGWNGGGDAGVHTYSGQYYQGGSGGGATDIRVNSPSLYARAIVAGGGGGSAYSYTGGVGGGLQGTNYNSTYAGQPGTQTAAGNGSTGGSYAYGTLNSSSVNGQDGDFGQGGNGGQGTSCSGGAGGGGGWYGGGGGMSGNSQTCYPGGGGSGYVYTSASANDYPAGCLLNSYYYMTNAQTVAGNTAFTNVAGTGNETGHEGDGYAIITPGISEYKVVVSPKPTATVIETTYDICGNQYANIEIIFSGAPPFTYRLTGDVADRVDTATRVFAQVRPSASTSYRIIYFRDGQCEGLTSATHADVVVCNQPIICAGDTVTLPQGNWYNDAARTNQIIDTFVAPVVTTTYYGDNNATFVVTVNPQPTATLRQETINICGSERATLHLQFTGTAPFRYRITGDNSERITYNNTDSVQVSPDSSMRYHIISMQDVYCYGAIANTAAEVIVCDQPIICVGDTVYLPAGQWFYDHALTQPILTNFVTPSVTTIYYRNAVDTINFRYTGDVQTYTVPSGVTSITMQVWGAQGGDQTAYGGSYYGGKGGYSEGVMSVSTGDVLNVYVGGKGQNGATSVTSTTAGGWNGGGSCAANTTSSYFRAGGGGGATDIRVNSNSLYARAIVAGGGGGAAYGASSGTVSGGNGGGTNGTQGTSSGYNTRMGGYGTQTAGGAAGTNTPGNGTAGNFGEGGTGGGGAASGGGGGAGWYGGGGGNYGSASAGCGGGGSGYVYTSATASDYPAGCLLNSSYYLANAQTIAGNTAFPDTTGMGTTEIGHSGDGYARIMTSGTGTYKVTVNPVPVANVVDTTWDICNGGFAQIEITFTGTAPFYYRLTGDVNERVAYSNHEFVNVRPSSSTNYKIETLSDANCEGGASVDRTAVIICSQPVICAGDTAILPQPRPWYYDQALTNAVPDTFVTPAATTTYYGANGATYTVSVNPQAVATMRQATVTKCNSQRVALHITFQGTAPFTYRVTGDVSDRITYSNSATVYVNPDTSMRYRVTLFHDDYCPGYIENTYTDVEICNQPVVCQGDTVVLPGGSWFYDAALTLPVGANFIVADTTVSLYKKAGDTTDFSYSGVMEMYEIPDGVDTVLLQVWGAQGGSYNTSYVGGKGGYSVGKLPVSSTDTLYVFVGGKGTLINATSTQLGGGFNGGGKATTTSSSYYTCGGGGGTDIRVNGTTLYSRVIVAGGGGGAHGPTTGYGNGGYGGGTTGGAGVSSTTSYYAGLGGTQTAVGSSYYTTTLNDASRSDLGGFGYGASALVSSSYSCGGGGGWYGGGSARRAGGGGGSGYVYTSATASNYPAGCLLNSNYYLYDAETRAGNVAIPDTTYNGTTETGHEGNGFARIIAMGSGSYKITVKPKPTATVHTNTQNICGTQSAEMGIKFTGTAPFYYRISGDTADRVSNTDTATLILRPNASTHYTITSISDANCVGVANTNYLTVIVCNQPIICAGDTAVLPELRPWFTDYARTDTIADTFVTPTTTTTYYGANNATYTVGVNPLATATMQQRTVNICGAERATLTINFTGSIPFYYRITGDVADRVSYTNTVNINVTPDSSTRYRVESFRDAFCHGTIARDFADVIVCNEPIICSGDTVWLPAGDWYYDAAKTQPVTTPFVVPNATTTYYTNASVNDTINFRYTGAVQSYTIPAGVDSVEMQVWGAQGGNCIGSSSSVVETGGKGGYSEGKMHVSTGDVLNVYVGGQGPSNITGGVGVGGYNGGGYGAATYSNGGTSYTAGSGGGATDIRVNSTSLYARAIVAGGGGGPANGGSTQGRNPGCGGGITGGSASLSYTYSGSYQNATGATQTAGGVWGGYGSGYTMASASYNGSFGQGGNPVNYSSNSNTAFGGGGGGWYGGAAAAWGPGSGGSGYVWTAATASNYPSGCLLTSAYYLTNAQTIAGNTSFPDTTYNGTTETGHSGNGYARIITRGHSSGTFKVTVNPKPVITIKDTTYNICDNDTAYVNLTFSGTAPFYYQLSGDAAMRVTNNTSVTIPVKPSVSTDYRVIAFYDAECEGDLVSDFTRVIVCNQPIICDGDTVPLPAGEWYYDSLFTRPVPVGFVTPHTTTTYYTPVKVRTVRNFAYTGTPQVYVVPDRTDSLKLEVWGAQGGQGGPRNTGGKGGYSYGTLMPNAGDTINIYVGGAGEGNSTTSWRQTLTIGGWNGGGNGNQWNNGIRAAGGGATDMRINSNSLYARVIVAGGGGGMALNSGYPDMPYIGGYGGGLNGGDGLVPPDVKGHGGTQTAGGASQGTDQYISTATFGAAATINSHISGKTMSGGGGGWYGGGIGTAAGGGSGYVYTYTTYYNYPAGCLLNSNYYLSNAQTIGGDTPFVSPNGTVDTGHVGNGYARITRYGDSTAFTTLTVVVNQSVATLQQDIVNVCDSNNTVTLNISFVGAPPFRYRITGDVADRVTNSFNESIVVTPDSSTTYVITSFSDAQCPGIITRNHVDVIYCDNPIACKGDTVYLPQGEWYWDATKTQRVNKPYIITDTTVVIYNNVKVNDTINFRYTGAEQTFTVPNGVDSVIMQVWGAQGGTRSGYTEGGRGGYSEGKMPVTRGDVLNVYVGGQGSSGASVPGGFNGGGLGISTNSRVMTSGGGGSDIRVNSTSLYARVIVAGGGGGGYETGNSGNGSTAAYGGGLTGGNGNGSSGRWGSGGTQTAGGAVATGTNSWGGTLNPGAFGIGGYAVNAGYSNGGGGGWYGGGCSIPDGGAGGGSGYVYTAATASNYPSGCLLNSSYYLVNAQTIAGNTAFPDTTFNGTTETGHEGNGYARIITRGNSAQMFKITVHPTYNDTLRDTICAGQVYIYEDSVYTIAGDYTHTRNSTLGCDSTTVLRLFVKDTFHTVRYDTICAGQVFSFNGNSYTVAGRYPNVIVASNGCDSNVIVHLWVKDTFRSTRYDTICRNQTFSYTGNNSNVVTYPGITSSTNDTVLVTTDMAVNGCDSNVVIYLHINDTFRTVRYDTICRNATFSYSGNNSNTIAYAGTTSLTNDTVLYTMNKTYRGCDSLMEIHLRINDTFRTIRYDTICRNTTFNYTGNNSNTIAYAGTTSLTNDTVLYTMNKTYRNCDSLMEIHLHINDTFRTQRYDTICRNETFTYRGNNGNVINYIPRRTNFSDTVIVTIDTTRFGCDSNVVINLHINDTFRTVRYDTICRNAYFTYIGNNGNAINYIPQRTGFNDTTILTVNRTVRGCDSTIEIRLHINDTFRTVRYDTICRNAYFNYTGNNSNSISYIPRRTGFSDTTIITVNRTIRGCDSNIEIRLHINDTFRTQRYDTICRNAYFTYTGNNGNVINYIPRRTNFSDTVIVTTDTSRFGCDSNVVINLHINDTFRTQRYDTICRNAYFTYTGNNGNVINYIPRRTNFNDTVIVTTDRTVKGCDSNVVINLHINDTFRTQRYDTICRNTYFNYTGNNGNVINYIPRRTNFNDTVIVTTDTTRFGCDSNVVIRLHINDTFRTVRYDTICRNAYFTYTGNNGNIINYIPNRTNFSDTTILTINHTVKGCDSTIEIRLHVNDTFRTQRYDTICAGQSFTFEGTQYWNTTTFVYPYSSVHHCDSNVVVNIWMNDTIRDTITRIICPGTTFDTNGQSYALAGQYTQYLRDNNFGCFNDLVINVVVSDTLRDTIYDTICTSGSVTINYETYTRAGTYRQLLKTPANCDLALMVYIAVADTIRDTIHPVICAGATHTENGVGYTHQGLYRQHLHTAAGCDSIQYIDLTVNDTIRDTITRIICAGHTFDTNNQSFSQQGQYTQYLRNNATGCFNDLVINIVVHDTFRTQRYDTICRNTYFSYTGNNGNSISYIPNRENFNDTVIVTTNRTVLGCDSNVVINLHINDTFRTVRYDTICRNTYFTYTGNNGNSISY